MAWRKVAAGPASGAVAELLAYERDCAARADAIGQAAAMLGDPAFSLEESYEAAEAAMPPGMVNSAGNIAVVLAEVERYGGLSED